MIDIYDVLDAQSDVFKMLSGRRRPDLERYARTIGDLYATNVAQDEAYQRRFNALYGVRRNAQWRCIFYDILERKKHDKAVEFGAVLAAILAGTGRAEASFASKLVATIDPNRAIYDSIVRKNLGIPNRLAGSRDQIARLEFDYAEIQRYLDELIRRPQFQELRERFDITFTEFRHFTDIKVLDLMIWQMREVTPTVPEG